MSSARDFLRSTVSDASLPLVRQLLEDVVMEVLNDRQVPTRTDFHELRDLVNSLRGQVSVSAGASRKLEPRIAELEEALARVTADRDALLARVEALESKVKGS
ncbi:MAG: hypothetical protein H6739_33190 [Alphaproteobacteria bacterium]|nr:hypothetical protein [Alphaproteobacteria bacterium]